MPTDDPQCVSEITTMISVPPCSISDAAFLFMPTSEPSVVQTAHFSIRPERAISLFVTAFSVNPANVSRVTESFVSGLEPIWSAWCLVRIHARLSPECDSGGERLHCVNSEHDEPILTRCRVEQELDLVR